jgi:hypothetical protein
METKKVYRVWPVEIDHIVIREGEYERNGKKVATKTLIFHVNVPGFEYERPLTMTAFEGTNSAVFNRYKPLIEKAVEQNGEKIIQQKMIKELLEPGKTEVEEYIDPYDENVYKSYGEYLMTMGTKFCRKAKKDQTSGMVIGKNMPISDGIQRWVLLDRDGNERKHTRNQKNIVHTTVDVCALVRWDAELNMWDSINCLHAGELEEALRYEIDQQIANSRWRLLDVPMENLQTLEASLQESAEKAKAEQEAEEAAAAEA